MTIGFPDFGRQTKQAGVTQVTVFQVITTSFFSPAQFIGDYGLLDVQAYCVNLADFYRVTAFFYDDSAATQLIYSYNFVTVPGVNNGLQIPAPGQYVRMFIEAANGTDVNPFTLRAISTNQRHPNPWYAYNSVPPFIQNVLIGAGAVRTTSIGQLITGPVVLCATGEGSGTWHIYLDYFDFATKTWITFWRYDTGGNTNGIDLPINLPPAPVRVNMSNDGTGSHQFLYSIGPEMV